MTDTPISTITMRPRRHAASPDTSRPLRVVALVDGSEATGFVVNTLLDLHARHLPLHVLVLNTQPAPQDWRMRGYGWFHREEVRDRLINELGGRVLASIARHLDAAGIPHEDRVELGDPLATMMRYAREVSCDLIVLGESNPGPLQRWLIRAAGLSFGSVAAAVARLAPVPVLVAR